jgi:hypothetical protein
MIRLTSPRADRLGEEIRELLGDLLAVEGALGIEPPRHPVHRTLEVEHRELGVDRLYRAVRDAGCNVCPELMVEPVAPGRDDLSVGWRKPSISVSTAKAPNSLVSNSR